MYIISPKTEFLGGALVSASHLGKLFPGKLLTWKKRSTFLDNNGVDYKIVNPGDPYRIVEKEIWVNDICIDEGYYPQYKDKNFELWEFLKGFPAVHIVNHQPISRVREYLYDMLKYITEESFVYLYNYRNCWNDEFNAEFGNIFHRKVLVGQLPYHYYLGYLPSDMKPIQYQRSSLPILSIGRSNSKCKIQSKLDIISKQLSVTSIYPDINVTNTELINRLNKSRFVLTGYYYGGEGNPEVDTIYNHLEWGFMDALLAWSIPVTSSLFIKELERLNIEAPVLDYYYRDLSQLSLKLSSTHLNNLLKLDEARRILIKELEFGNKILSDIISRS